MTGIRLFLALLSALLLPGLISCQSEVELPDTAITLRVKSDSELNRLELRFLNLQNNEQVVDFPLTLDLRDEEFIFSIQPGALFRDDVFIWVKGYLDDTLIAQASRLTTFVQGEIVEETFELRASFIDGDGDGFSPCSSGPSCDCDDTQASINPLALEICGDVIDNNCNGAAEEDCPCTEDQICTVVPDTFIDVSAGIGQCQFGIRRCTDGVLAEECEGALGIGGEEILGNYIDDDCDGSVDEGGPCSPDTVRPCFLGFIDDEAHPDSTLRRGASDRALGVCQAGTQLCSSNGTWQSCQGEVRPQRDPETGVFNELTTQCDGLDNDCDGVIDDEPYFDADADGFTRCGTCRLGTDEGLCAESIDCDDTNPIVSPAAIELCGNEIDEDCRCDHDDRDRPIGPASAISKPSLALDGSRACAEENTYLSCSRLPRSDPEPTGLCSELDTPYFAGFVEDEAGLLGACMSCGLLFGLQCLADGGCSDPEYDCRACNVPDEVFAPRPHCTEPNALTCRNDIAPTFDPIFGLDPYEDCGELSCEGYYFGIDGEQCFRRADIRAAEVLCQGAEACEDAATLCPSGQKNDTPESMPLCTYVSDGCQGITPPVFTNQVVGSDVFGACNDAYQCDQASDTEGPFYHGIYTDGGLAYCFYKAPVENNACNGSGACQSKTEACLIANRGSPVGSRPQCELPVGGCAEEVGPIYGPVEQFQDPYNDCSGDGGCCVDDVGNGVCCQAQGAQCSVDSECASGLSCVEGVCCDGLCDSPCQSCVASLSNADEDGICAALAERSLDVAPSLVCGDGAGECGGDGGCECVAGTGECRRDIGSSCDVSNECSTLSCECSDGACDETRCVPEACRLCRFDSDQDGDCEGFIADGVDDFAERCGALGCNGLGGCNVENTLPCSVNQECLSNICRQGTCGPQAGVGGTCDENADCLSPARCEVGLLCGIPGLVASQTSLITVVEGGSAATLGVGVASQPSVNTILTLASSNLEFTVSPLSLSFGPDDWQSTKTVTITPFNDVIDDGDIEGELQVSVSSTLDSGYNTVGVLTVPIRVNDNDEAGFVVAPATGAIPLNEGESTTGSVSLATEPTADVTLTLSSADASEVAVTSSLTFTPDNWDTPQEFVVEALLDSSEDGDQSVALTISVSSSSDLIYSTLQPALLTVSVSDIDQAGLLITDSDSLTVDESGAFAEFSVALSARPNRNVTVPLSLDPTGQASLAATSLTFTKNNWSVPQTVRVTGVDDFIDDGTVIFYVIVGPTSSSDNQFDDFTRQVLVSALDDDDSAIVRGNPSTASLSENGGASTYALTLSSQPTHSVSIPVASQDPSLSVSPETLVLNASNWNTGVSVTVTGQDDFIAQGSRDVTLTWGPSESVDSNYDEKVLLATSLEVLDDDLPGIFVGADNLGVGENGSSVLGKFRLTSQPTEVVNLEFSGGVGEVTFAPDTLSFNPLNWDTDQFVTITGVDDDVDDGLQTETITVAASSIDTVYQGISETFSVQNADNDIAEVSVDLVGDSNISENSGSSEFTVTLDTRPLHDVTVVFSSNNSRATVVNGLQIFTPSQWNELRTVTLAGNDDELDNGNVDVVVSASVTSLDPLYDGITVVEQAFTLIDDDSAGLVFGAISGFEVIEGDAQQASTTVKLNSQPVEDVTLSFSVDSTEIQMVSSPLTFTALNWDQNQSIIFTSVDDAIDDGAQETDLVVSSLSSDSDYSGLSQVLSCTTQDNDTAGVSVSVSTLSVTEGDGVSTVTVQLDSEPTDSVSLTLATDTADLSLSKVNLTFDSSNWSTPQAFTVEATDDSIYEADEVGTLSITSSLSSDAIYAGLSGQDFDFNVSDNESLPEVSISDLTVSEGDSDVALSISVSVSPLSYQAITVGYTTQNDSASAGLDYQSAAGNVVIEAGDSSAVISVTLSGDNLLESDEDFLVSLTSLSLGGFALGGDTARITIEDDDASPTIVGIASSSASLSASLSTTSSLTCDFTDADFTQGDDYELTLVARGPDNSTEYLLCSGTSSSEACAAGGSPSITEPSSGQYRFTYDWDPTVGLPDGDYDFRCEISDGTNSGTTAFTDNLDELTLDSTSPTVIEVREASGGAGSYSEDDDLLLEIEFSEVVVIAGGTGLSLGLDVNEIVGLQGATASYLDGSGSNVLRFRYIVEDSSWAETSDLEYPDQAALTLSGSTTLTDSVGNSADLTLPVPGSAQSLSGTSDIELN